MMLKSLFALAAGSLLMATSSAAIAQSVPGDAPTSSTIEEYDNNAEVYVGVGFVLAVFAALLFLSEDDSDGGSDEPASP